MLYIPELRINILSTNSIKDSICLFINKSCYIYKKKRRILTCVAYKKDKLYKTEIDILCKRNNEIYFFM